MDGQEPHSTSTTLSPDGGSRRRWGHEVHEVADLLRGRSVLVIGGIPRPAAVRSLAEAFGLSAVYWPHNPSAAVACYDPFVARPDVAVVLMAVRWSRHSFGDVRQACQRLGKPFVMLPGGYSPNQVAVQILGQCSHRLRMRPVGSPNLGE